MFLTLKSFDKLDMSLFGEVAKSISARSDKCLCLQVVVYHVSKSVLGWLAGNHYINWYNDTGNHKDIIRGLGPAECLSCFVFCQFYQEKVGQNNSPL